jgi:hypothetical protein
MLSAPQKKKGPAKFHRARKTNHRLMAVVIVVIPIAIGMPAMAVFIPPTMALIPAAFTRLMQIVARVIGLPAVPAVVLYGFMQPVVCLGDTPLASIVAFGGCPGRSCECQHANKCGSSEYRLLEELLLSHMKRHVSSILLSVPDWDGVCCSIEHTGGENVANAGPHSKYM